MTWVNIVSVLYSCFLYSIAHTFKQRSSINNVSLNSDLEEFPNSFYQNQFTSSATLLKLAEVPTTEIATSKQFSDMVRCVREEKC